jgi:naphthalene 1,2-dioxygenase ferredoxin component
MTSSTSAWIDAAAESDLWDDAGVSVVVAGHDIGLFRVGGAVYAIDNQCTHGNARLCDGFVDGLEIECPLHQGRFDLATGQATCGPAADAVRRYPVRIEGGRVHLQVD